MVLTIFALYLQDDEEGDEDDDDEGSEMELDEDFPDINAAPHIRFERFDRDDDLIIEFDNMFSTSGKSFRVIYVVFANNKIKPFFGCQIC